MNDLFIALLHILDLVAKQLIASCVAKCYSVFCVVMISMKARR